MVHVDTVQRNSTKMLARAKALGCDLRPHVKTSKTVQAALLQTGGRKSKIVVSTLAEAAFYADAGFDDILYAVPITMDKLGDASTLAQRLGSFHLLVDNAVTVANLQAAPGPGGSNGGGKWSVFVMVDCGYHRDGVDPSDPASVEMARKVANGNTTTLAGCYTHGGHSYENSTAADVKAVAATERDAVVLFSQKLKAAGVRCETVGVGSTPTCSVPPDHLNGVNEMHPGNYVYYDVMQRDIGACTSADIATRVLTRVIGHYPAQNMMLIDLGWTGCSAQGGEHGYGAFLETPSLTIKVLKQEAGEVSTVDGSKIDFTRFPIGTMLQLAPYHACAATHQHRVIHALAADHATIIDTWNICKGWGGSAEIPAPIPSARL